MKIKIIGSIYIDSLSKENKQALLDGDMLEDVTIHVVATHLVAEDDDK